jgi:hypothetical protein
MRHDELKKTAIDHSRRRASLDIGCYACFVTPVGR